MATSTSITSMNNNYGSNKMDIKFKGDILSGKKKKRSIKIHESSDESEIEDPEANFSKKHESFGSSKHDLDKSDSDLKKESASNRHVGKRLLQFDFSDDSDEELSTIHKKCNDAVKTLSPGNTEVPKTKHCLRLDDSSDDSDIETINFKKTLSSKETPVCRTSTPYLNEDSDSSLASTQSSLKKLQDSASKKNIQKSRWHLNSSSDDSLSNSSDSSDSEQEESRSKKDGDILCAIKTKSKEVRKTKRLSQLGDSADKSDSENKAPKQILPSKSIPERRAIASSSDDDSDSPISSTRSLKKKFQDTNKDVSNVLKQVMDSDSDSSDEDMLAARSNKKKIEFKKSTIRRSSSTDQDSDKENDGQSSSSSESSSSEEDDNAPPIRIFRNINAAAMNSRGYDSGNGSSNDESEGELLNNEVPMTESVERPRRKAKRIPKPMEIKSETQRLIRESRVNLPYHMPETKKLSQFMKRPFSFQDKLQSLTKITENANPEAEKKDEKMDSGVEIPDLHFDDNKGDFINLDDEEPTVKQSTEITNFMERFLKHSKLETSATKKKVQFNIIKKEERADGSGADLVSEVVTHSNEENKKDTVASYKTLREKLAAKMKKRRSEERQKRQELFKLDNEEIGSENNEEEEEEDFTDEETSEEEMEVKDEVDDGKNHVIEDDDEDVDNALEPTQLAVPEISNVSSISKTSLHELKSDTPAHLIREESGLLFEDTTKKSSCSREGSFHEHNFDSHHSLTIPPNKSLNMDDSSLKLPRLSTDEDSYFCTGRSINLSNQSPSCHEYESQFFDSDGFIKETNPNKSINSLLPPGGEDDNANDCNMSQLLELCSGKFQVSTISPHTSDDVNGSTDVNGAYIDESFGFQVDTDSPKKEENLPDFSDNEHNDSEGDEDDNGITIVRKKKDVAGRMAKNFLEDEAELSGEDVDSEDEEEEQGANHYESDENDEQLPKEEELQQQVNKVHLKQLLDDDQRDIDLLQEAFVTEAVDVRRNRKFRWKNIDDNLTPDLFHSDEENENPGDDLEEVIGSEESQWRMHRLQREEYINSKTEDGNSESPECPIEEEDSQLLRMGRHAIRKNRILSEINEDSRTNSATLIPPLTRSTSLTTGKLPSRNSFLARKPEILSKFASFKEASVIKGAVNSDRMVFKAVSPSKKNVKVKRPAMAKKFEIKRPRLDEDSNSIFNLFEM